MDQRGNNQKMKKYTEIKKKEETTLGRRCKMAEEWMEGTLTTYHDQSGITTKLWGNHPEQTTEQK